MNRILTISAALALFVLTGCATKPYACPLKKGAQHCGSMQEVYDVARKAPRNVERQDIYETAHHERAAASPTFSQQTPADQPEIGQPVFKQPRVHRVWIAPYVDANGNLRTGEYTYFNTPGEWNYGTTREAGDASSATFGPQKPESLGFTPVVKSSKKGAPPKPDLPAPSTNADGITQPTHTLAN